MAYIAKFINPCIQYGKKNYTLVIEDADGILPTYTIAKQFPEDITEEQLTTEGENAILIILAIPNEVEVIEEPEES